MCPLCCGSTCDTTWIRRSHWKRSFSIKLAFFDVILFPAIRVRNKILLLFLQFILQHFRGPNKQLADNRNVFARPAKTRDICSRFNTTRDWLDKDFSPVSSAFRNGLVNWKFGSEQRRLSFADSNRVPEILKRASFFLLVVEYGPPPFVSHKWWCLFQYPLAKVPFFRWKSPRRTRRRWKEFSTKMYSPRCSLSSTAVRLHLMGTRSPLPVLGHQTGTVVCCAACLWISFVSFRFVAVTKYNNEGCHKFFCKRKTITN